MPAGLAELVATPGSGEGVMVGRLTLPGYGSPGFLGWWRADGGQAGGGIAAIRANAATSCSTQGQVLGSRSRRRLAPWTSRGGDVQEPIPQRFGFGFGEIAVEGQHLEPGHQIGGDHRVG